MISVKAKAVIPALLILFIGSNVFGENKMRSPEDIPKKREIKETIVSDNPLSIFFNYSVKFFQAFISPVDGDRCNMHPTCSAYSREAVRKYGAVKGFIMTADRLIHEGDEQKFAPRIKKGKSVRYYDPPENNDFWPK